MLFISITHTILGKDRDGTTLMNETAWEALHGESTEDYIILQHKVGMTQVIIYLSSLFVSFSSTNRQMSLPLTNWYEL